MEEGGEEIVVDPALAGLQFQQAQVHHHGDEEHVAEHRGLGQARRLRPALLESQLAAEIEKAGDAAAGKEIGEAGQRRMVLHARIDLPLDLLDVVGERGDRIDDLELPAGRGIMGRPQQPFLQAGFILDEKPVPHPFEKLRGAGKLRFQLFQHPGIQLRPLLLHHPVEDGGLEIGEQAPLQAFKDRPLDQPLPVDLVPGLLLELGQHIGDDHLVRLLVQLGELDRPDLVVPPLQRGAAEQAPDQSGMKGFVGHGWLLLESGQSLRTLNFCAPKILRQVFGRLIKTPRPKRRQTFIGPMPFILNSEVDLRNSGVSV